MPRWWLVLALVMTASPARADYAEETFAAMMHVEEANVVKVVGLELPAGSHFQRALVGRYKHREHQSSAVVLLRCNAKQCTGKTVSLGNGEVALLGLVDLAMPGALPTKRIEMPRHQFTSLDKKPTKRAWPALLVRTKETRTVTTKSYRMKDVTGTQHRAELAILSLARADAEWPRILNEEVDVHYPTGVGRYVSFELVRGKGKALDLLATKQRSIDKELKCIRPKPTQSRYTLDETTKHRQYRETLAPVTGGCR